MEVGICNDLVRRKDLDILGFHFAENGINDCYIREILERLECTLGVEEEVSIRFALRDPSRQCAAKHRQFWKNCRPLRRTRRGSYGTSGSRSTCAITPWKC